MIRKKVLLIARDYPPLGGGISAYISQIYHYFSPDELVVIAYYWPGCEDYDKCSPWKVIRTGRFSARLSKGKPAIIPLLLVAIWYLLLNRKSVRVLHAEQVQSSVAAYICSRLFGLPMCVFAYGMEITTADRLGFKRRMYDAAEKVFTISSYSRELLLRKGIEDSKIRLFSPGVSREAFAVARKLSVFEARRRLRLSDDKTILLTVARLVVGAQYKGIDLTLRALPQVLQHHPNVMYCVLGDGNDRERLVSIVRELGLDQVVQFAGQVGDEEKGLYYAACDIFVMPNRIIRARDGENTEGFGIVFIEANLFGKPVIGGLGGATDAVEDGVSGLTINPDSIESIGAAIVYLLDNPGASRQLGSQGQQRVLKRFLTEDIARSFYRECMTSV